MLSWQDFFIPSSIMILSYHVGFLLPYQFRLSNSNTSKDFLLKLREVRTDMIKEDLVFHLYHDNLLGEWADLEVAHRHEDVSQKAKITQTWV